MIILLGIWIMLSGLSINGLSVTGITLRSDYQVERMTQSYDAAAFDSNGTLWGATNNTLYKSTDFGETHEIVDTIANGTEVRRVFVDSNDNIYWSARNGQYVRRSTDGGDSWSTVFTLPGGVSDHEIWGMCESPITGSIFFGDYAVDGEENAQVYRSQNGGATFSSSLYDEDERHIHDVFCAADGDIYAMTGDTNKRLYRSDDDGDSWLVQHSGNAITSIEENLSGFLVLGGDDPDLTFVKLYTSDDDGITWTTRYQKNISYDIFWILNFGNNILLAGSVKDPASATVAERPHGYLSTDGGISWEFLEQYEESNYFWPLTASRRNCYQGWCFVHDDRLVTAIGADLSIIGH